MGKMFNSYHKRNICALLILVLGGVGGYVASVYFSRVPEKIYALQAEWNPRILFHGSSNRTIKTLEPRALKTRNVKDGAVIFATPHLGLAAKFMVQWDDSWVLSGSSDNLHYYFICSDRERFMKMDTGGAIYIVPSDTFFCKPGVGLGYGEWMSHEAVKPVHKMEFSSTLEAMMQFGIQVYFVDPQTFDAIRTSTDLEYGLIIKSLTSENEKRGMPALPVVEN